MKKAARTLLLILAAAIIATAATGQPETKLTILAGEEHPLLDEPLDLRFSLAINDILVISYELKAEVIGPSGTSTPLDLTDNRQGYKYATYSPKQPGTHTVRATARIGGVTITEEKAIEAEQPAPTFALTANETRTGNPTTITGTIRFHQATNTTRNVTLAIEDPLDHQLHPLCTVSCHDECDYTCYTQAPLLPLTYTLKGQHTATATPSTAELRVLPAPGTKQLHLTTPAEASTNTPHPLSITLPPNTSAEGRTITIQDANHQSEAVIEVPARTRTTNTTLTFTTTGIHQLHVLLTDAATKRIIASGEATIIVEEDLTRLTIDQQELSLHHDPYHGQYWYTTTITPKSRHRTILITGNEDCPFTKANAWGQGRIRELAPAGACEWALGEGEAQRIELLTEDRSIIARQETKRTKSKLHITTPEGTKKTILRALATGQEQTYRMTVPLPAGAQVTGVQDELGRPLEYASGQGTTSTYTDRPTTYITLAAGLSRELEPTAREEGTHHYVTNASSDTAITINEQPGTNATIIIDGQEQPTRTTTLPPGPHTIIVQAKEPARVSITAHEQAPPITMSAQATTNGTTHHALIQAPGWGGNATTTLSLIGSQGTASPLNATILHEKSIWNASINLSTTPPGTYLLAATINQEGKAASTLSKLTITNPEGGITIDGPKEAQAAPGETITLTHVVTNLEATRSSIINLHVNHELESVTLYRKRANTIEELADSDRDGAPDTGILKPGESIHIIAKIRLPSETSGEARVRWEAAYKEHRAAINDTITIIKEEELIIPTYHDLAVAGMRTEEGILTVGVRNNDDEPRTVLLAVKRDQETLEQRRLELPPSTTKDISLPLPDKEEPYTISATLTTENGDPYEDLYPNNNQRERHYDSRWTHDSRYRTSVLVKETRGKPREDYYLRAAIDLPDDALLDSITALLPTKRGLERIDYSYLLFNTTTKNGFLLLHAQDIPANWEGDLYLYFDQAKHEPPIIQQKEPGIIIDNADPHVKTTGQWIADYLVPGYLKADYYHDFGRGKGEKSITISPSLAESFAPSTYEVYAHHPQDPEFSPNAKYRITHAKGTEEIALNQRIEGGTWRYLGFYELDDKSRIEVTNEQTAGIVVLDAIKLLNIHQYTTATHVEEHPRQEEVTEEDEQSTFTYDVEAQHPLLERTTVRLIGAEEDTNGTTSGNISTAEQRHDLVITGHDEEGTIIDQASIRCSKGEEGTLIAPVQEPQQMLLNISCAYDGAEAAISLRGGRGKTRLAYEAHPHQTLSLQLEEAAGKGTYEVQAYDEDALEVALEGTTLSITPTAPGTRNKTINLTRDGQHEVTITITTTTSQDRTLRQGPARVGEPVTWTKKPVGGEAKLPPEATSIRVEGKDPAELKLTIGKNTITAAEHEELTQLPALEKKRAALTEEKAKAGVLRKATLYLEEQQLEEDLQRVRARRAALGIGKHDISIDVGAASEEITYETPAPQKEETPGKGATIKKVKVYSDVSMHYRNVSASTQLPPLPIKPRLYHVINGVRKDVTDDERYDLAYVDLDGDGKPEEARWNVPHLSDQYFEFGLATINTLKPVHHPGDEARILVVVLDNEGHLVPGADVRVNITGPDNKTTLYTTRSGHITETEEGVYSLVHADTGTQGTYRMDVSAQAPGVDNDMTSTFEVHDDYPFEIARDVPATIDPWREELRTSITITSYGPEDAMDVREEVPSSFLISDAQGASITVQDGKKMLLWEGVPNGTTLRYTAALPLITPTMYELGKVTVSYGEQTYEEARPWYLAVDPIKQETKTCLSVTTSGTATGDGNGNCSQVQQSDGVRPAGGDNSLESYVQSSSVPAIFTEYFATDTPAGVNITSATLTAQWNVEQVGGAATCTLEVNNGTAWSTISTTCQGVDTNYTYDVTNYIRSSTAANNFAFRITYYGEKSGPDRNDLLWVDYVHLVINYTVAPGYNTWSLNVSDGAAIKRGQPVLAYARWNYTEGLIEARISHDGQGSYTNYSIPGPYTGNWTNYTLDTANTTEFDRVGIIRVKTIYARDNEVWNSTAPEKTFKLYDDANVSQSAITAPTINQSQEANISCRVMDLQLGTPISDYTVFFYRDGTYKASKKTNATGWATYDATYSTPGTYNISCSIQDSGYYYALSGADSSYQLLTVLDSTAPAITLAAPADGAQSTSQDVTFTYNVSDTHSSLSNCSLYLNGTLNETNSTPITEAGENQINATLAYDVYEWTIGCYDDSANNNYYAPANRTLTVAPDTQGPVITYLQPPDGATTTENVTFRFTVTDALSGIENCTLVLDGIDNQTNTSIGNGDTVDFPVEGIANGLHSWRARCYDNSTQLNMRKGTIRTFTVGEDEDGPLITVLTPANNTKDTDNHLNITFTADDYINGVENCSLYINGSLNQTNSSVDESATQSWYFADIAEGSYYYNITCYDNSTNNNSETTPAYYFTIDYDYDDPDVDLVSPENQYQDVDGDVTFLYTVADENPITSCILLINGTLNQTDTSITRDVNQQFTLTNMPNGDYDWQVNCTDETDSANEGASETRNFSIGPDTIGPQVTLFAPSEGITDSDGDILFTFQADDVTSGVDSCKLFIDGLEEQTSSAITEGAEEQFSHSLANGVYAWYINCTDDSPQQNVGLSEERNLTVSISYESEYDFSLPQASYAAGALISPLASLQDPGGSPIASATAHAYIVRNQGTDNQTLSWNNASFPLRMEQRLTNSLAEAQEMVPVSITLDTSALIAAGTLNADCSDLRIADQENNNLDYYFYDADNGCGGAAARILVLVERLWANRTHSIGLYYGNASATTDVSSRSAMPVADNFDDGDTFPSGTGYWSTSQSDAADTWGLSSANAYDGTNSALSAISCNNFCQSTGGRAASFTKSISLTTESTLHWRWARTGGTLRFKLDGTEQSTASAATWTAGSQVISAGTHTLEWEFEVTTQNNYAAYLDQVYLVTDNASSGSQSTQSAYVATLTSQTTDANGNATFTWDSTGEPYGNYSVTGHALKGSYWGDNGSASFSLGPDTQNPVYSSWQLNISDGATVLRGEPVLASAYWTDDVGLDAATLQHNGTSVLANYPVTPFGGTRDSWGNYTLDTSDGAEFPSLGLINVTTMSANDTTGNANTTTPAHHFYLYGYANISGASVNATDVDEGKNFTMSCSIADATTGAAVQGYTVSFYFGGALKGTSATNATGWATYDVQTDVPGTDVEATCRIANQTSIYYYRTSPYESTLHVNVTDVIAPSVTGFTPENNSVKTTPYHSPSFTVSDTGTLDECRLYGNWEGSWGLKDTITDPDNGGFPNINYFSPITFGAGEYTWYVNCLDDAGNLGTSGNMTFNISLQEPNVDLVVPGTDELWSPGNKNVTYTVQLPDPLVGIDNCSIYVDGAYDQSHTGIIAKATQHDFDLGYLDYGRYLINVTCHANNTKSGHDTEYINILELESLLGAANGTAVDRDNLSAEPDSISLGVNERGDAENVSVTFKANLTDPSLGLLQNTTLGTALTNSTGHATYDFDPGTTHLAGNYTWWAAFTTWPSNTTQDSRWFINHGFANIVFADTATRPSSTYTYGQNATIGAIAQSLGDETSDQLNATYGASLNVTLTSPRNESLNSTLAYNGTEWTWTFNTSAMRRHGEWNVTLNGSFSSTYLSTNETQWRTMLVNLTGIGIPSVELGEPYNDTTHFFVDPSSNESLINFTWRANDTIEDTTFCNLTLDGGVNVTEAQTQNATWNNVSIAFTGSGIHHWNVTCTDDANTATSPAYTFKVVSPDSYLSVRNYTVSGSNASVYEQVNYTANYTNFFADPISGNCTITFSDGSNDTMIYNATSELYEYNRTTTYYGLEAWSVNCSAPTYYDNATASGSFYINPLLINVTSPPDGTVIDRDSGNATANDTATFIANIDTGISGINISFYLNRTAPGEELIFLGKNLTNGTGYARLTYDPSGSVRAGNYTVYANASAGVTINTGYVRIVGTLNVTFENSTFDPDASYTHNSTIIFNATIASWGDENDSTLERSYLENVTHAFMTSPSAATKNGSLSRTTANRWNGSVFINTSDEKGIWNASVKAQSPYFFTALDWRTVNITKFPANISAWDQYDAAGGRVPAYIGHDTSFYANYTSTTGSPAPSATCTIDYGDATSGNTTYNATSALNENRTKQYAAKGNYTWNLTCTSPWYEDKQANGSLLVYRKTDVNVKKTTSSPGDDQVGFTIEVTNNAVYDELLSAYDLVPENYTAYAYNYGPNQTLTITDPQYAGEATKTNATVASASTLTIMYTANATGRYHYPAMFIIGG